MVRKVDSTGQIIELTQQQAKMLGSVISIGDGKWFQLTDVEQRMKSGLSRARVRVMMYDLKWRLDQMNHTWQIEGARGRGYRLLKRGAGGESTRGART